LNAQTAIEIGLRGGVIPAAAALALFLAMGWLWSSDVARRYRPGLAFGLAVLVGYILLPSTITLVPAQFYDWIPYLGALAAYVTGLTRAGGVLRGERWTAVYLFAPVAAWLIVPRWPELVPAWPAQWAGLAIGIVLLTALLQPLPQRLPGRAFPMWLMLTAAAVSLLVMAEVSETFGRLALLAAGALAGCGIGALMMQEAADWRGLLLPYAIVVGGYAYTGFVYPIEPLWPLLLAPAAPLALWICLWGPLTRVKGARAIALQGACVAVPLVALAAWLLAGTNDADAW